VGPEGRAAHVISQVYYYLAAVIGFSLLLGGAIAALLGVRELILPREHETVREGIRTLLHGLAFALPGLALVWWNLREARRRESQPTSQIFWGRALYFHLMALVALVFVLIGGIGVLFHLGDAVMAADCPDLESLELSPPRELFDFCFPDRSESLRNAVDSAIFLIVAGPVFWWHLRQGRRVTAPESG
jgi:hypothetical protein